MRAFKEKRGVFVARVDAAERDVLASLVADVAQLLGGVRIDELSDAERAALAEPAPSMLRTEAAAAPDDPAVLRLLPDASRDDPAVSAEFRRLTQDDLRARKLGRLVRLWDDLTGDVDELRVPAERGDDVAAALTDVRLVVAQRLGVTTDEDAEGLYDELGGPGDDAGRFYLVSVYTALTWLQESLVTLLLARHRRGDDAL
jgi:hypothetical protein